MLYVEFNYIDLVVLFVGFCIDSNDLRILSCVVNFVVEGKWVMLVSKDILLCVKVVVVGLVVDEYYVQDVVVFGWLGMYEFEIVFVDIDVLFVDGEIDLVEVWDLLCYIGIWLLGGGFYVLGWVNVYKCVQLV